MGNQGFLVWKGKDNDQRIFWSREQGPGRWLDQQQVRYFGTNRGLAAAADPDRANHVWAAWKGADDDTRIWTAACDGDSWSDQQLPTGAPRTADRPALAFYGGELVMAWRGTEADEHIWFAKRGPGGWSEQQLAGNGLASSTHGPALAVHQGRLFMAWKGSGGNQNLYWTSYDGSSWADPQSFRGGSTHGPAMVSVRSQLHMAWKGSGSDDRLWHAVFDGDWSPQAVTVGRSSHGPSLGIVDIGGIASAVMVWKGAAGDPRIWWSRSVSDSQVAVADGAFGTSDTPAVASVALFDL